MLRLAFLPPRIIKSILNGNAPANFSLERLKDVKYIDLGWAEQHRRNSLRPDPPPVNLAAENFCRLPGSTGGLGDSLVRAVAQTPANA
jgi:hypothetical protein